MSKILVIPGADFSNSAILFTRLEGTPGYTLIPSIGSGSFKINELGFCLIDDIVTPDANGRFALGNYNADNNDITKIRACWDVPGSGIRSFTQLFCRLKAMTEIDCTALDTNGITDYSHCFRYCNQIENIDLSTWTSNRALSTVSYMFDGCTSLKTVDLGTIEIRDTATTMFTNCPNLEKVRTHFTNDTLIGYIRSVLNSANAGGSSNWVQGVDTDGVAMLTPAS